MNIIINADDFGTTKELNDCVLHLHKAKIVKSATIIANSSFFEDAVKIAKSNPELGIGIHLCLDGPFNVLQNPSTLVNPLSGRFFDRDEARKKLKMNDFKYEDIIREYENQIEKVLNSGITISHIDHHHHLHVYFQSLRAIIKLAKKYNIKCIRSQRVLIPRNKNLLNAAYRYFHQIYVRSSLICPDGYFEFIAKNGNAFEINIGRIEKLLNKNYKTIEFECHTNSEKELDTLILRSPVFMKLLSKHKNLNYNEFLSL